MKVLTKTTNYTLEPKKWRGMTKKTVPPTLKFDPAPLCLTVWRNPSILSYVVSRLFFKSVPSVVSTSMDSDYLAHCSKTR